MCVHVYSVYTYMYVSVYIVYTCLSTHLGDNEELSNVGPLGPLLPPC